MRRLLIIFILVAFCGILPGFVPSSAAAPAAQSTADKQTAELKKLEAGFQALCKDAKKGGLRDNWFALEKKFTKLAGAASGDTAARAAYFSARCLQELGARSYVKSDHQKAFEAFGAVLKKYPKAGIVPYSMYQRAAILGLRLNKTAEANKIIGELKRSYPKSAAAKDAEALEKKLTSKGGGDAQAKKDSFSGSSGKPSSDDVLKQLGLTVKTIMLDAGHGGKDPGCQANGIVEKNFNLALVKLIGEELKKKGFTVIYTRTTDAFVSLEKRPELANSKNADLFISIHVNANAKSAIHGLEIYYLDVAKSSDANKVAARENGVSVQELSNVQVILADLMLSSKIKESHSLAGCLQTSIMGRLKKGKVSFADHGVRSAPFYVLMGARMPAVLIECGYATNADDAKKLKSKDFMKLQAQGVVDGIVKYKQELSKISR